MKQVTVAICDDISREALSLEKYICEFVQEAVITKYTRGELLIDRLSSKADVYDIIFLKIDMAKEDGLVTASRIRKTSPRVHLVLISDSEEYYREAFDLFAFQYLLTPVDRDKIRVIFEMLAEPEETEKEKIVYFRYRSQIHTIRHSEIVYISSSLHTVIFHLANGRSVHCRGKLSDFEEQLKDSSLLRCHQSFFVNIEYTTGMKTDSFILNDNVIPISRSYVKEAQKAYQEYLQTKEKE